MIHEDRELLAELARVNSAAAPLAMRIMAETATIEEQHGFAARLIQLAARFTRRAEQHSVAVVPGEVVTAVDLPDVSHTGASHRQP
ncbi:MAG: hypothetical protein M3R63_10585 [Actinomycetota bacterium]|nr:hypothetical protein [Actinomycetota bacterium]